VKMVRRRRMRLAPGWSCNRCFSAQIKQSCSRTYDDVYQTFFLSHTGYCQVLMHKGWIQATAEIKLLAFLVLLWRMITLIRLPGRFALVGLPKIGHMQPDMASWKRVCNTYSVHGGTKLRTLTLDPGRHLASLELTGLLPLDTLRVACDGASCKNRVSELSAPVKMKMQSIPSLSAGLRSGSCAINALETANIMASACPVVPPPEATAQTLYLSRRCVAFNAHTALSLSCRRPKYSVRDLPFTIASPVPSTT